jgi:hypothetical protein
MIDTGDTGPFRLGLGRPTHGWLPFRLELAGVVIDDAASNVLNDPVDELLGLLAYSLTPRGTEPRVCFWLEPAGYALDACTVAGSADRFIVRLFFDESFVPPMRRHTMQLRAEAELAGSVLSAGVRAGLATLLAGQDRGALDGWRSDRSHQTYLDRFQALERNS